jgi:hypothetical protein
MELSAIEFVSKRKIRFQTTKGPLSIEDLWDLPLTSETGRPNLDSIAKTIHSGMKDDEISFVPSATSTVSIEQRMSLEAVKRIIAFKVEEREAAKNEREKSSRKQEILEALAAAEKGALTQKTPEELRAMLAAI